MEVEKAVIRSVISKCRTRDIERLFRKWGWFSDEDIQRLNFRATKKAIATQIIDLCKVSYPLTVSGSLLSFSFLQF